MPTSLDLINDAFNRFVISQTAPPASLPHDPQAPNGSAVPNFQQPAGQTPIPQPAPTPQAPVPNAQANTTQQAPVAPAGFGQQPPVPQALHPMLTNAAAQTIIQQMQGAPLSYPQLANANPHSFGSLPGMNGVSSIGELLASLQHMEAPQAAAVINALFPGGFPHHA